MVSGLLGSVVLSCGGGGGVVGRISYVTVMVADDRRCC
jgi:hypothetical protein